MITATLKSLGITWPPPSFIEIDNHGELPNLLVKRVSCSEITDEQRAEMTHVARGALYEPCSYAELPHEEPQASQPFQSPDRTLELHRMNAEVSSAAAAAPRFIKIGEDGRLLAADATDWVAVLDTKSNLMWAAEVLPRQAFKAAGESVAKLKTGGFTDWRMPTVEELFCLADRTRREPAIDTDFFPKTPSSWFWSGTLDASSPSDYAWDVYFGSGSPDWSNQLDVRFVRAVRPSGD